MGMVPQVSRSDALASDNDEFMTDLKPVGKVKAYGGLMVRVVEECEKGIPF